MSLLKSALLSFLASNCAIIAIDASQPPTPKFNFISPEGITPQEDSRLRQELHELIQLDTELGLNVLQPGMRLGVNKPWVDWLRFCITQKRVEKFEIESFKMFMHKGKLLSGYEGDRQKIAADKEFVLFNLPPVNKFQAQQIDEANTSLSSQSPDAAPWTIYAAAKLVVKQAEENAQEYQRRCDSIALDPTEYVNARERRLTTGDLTHLPG